MTNVISLRGVRKTGDEFLLDLSLSSWPANREIFYHVVLRDMTEHMHTQSEIARLASFPEANPIPVVEINPAGTVTYSNPAARLQFPEMKYFGFLV